jgi:hypothetical protein
MLYSATTASQILLVIDLFWAALFNIDPGVGVVDGKEGVAERTGWRVGGATTKPPWRGLEAAAALFAESTGMGMRRCLVEPSSFGIVGTCGAQMADGGSIYH